jgi:hypothetical protein
MDEVAYFDVIPAVDIAEFAGTWSNYRFPGSGNVVVSTIENAVNGLMVLRPTLDGEPPVSGGPGDNRQASKHPDPPAKPKSKKRKAKKCKKKKAKGKAKRKRKRGKRKKKRRR